MKYILTLSILILHINIYATVWQVGPTKTYTYCSQVAPLVQNGDTVEIDYATYINDPQVQWNQNNLVLKGVGGRPVLQAGSIIANDATNGKGIFVIGGQNVRVENIEFANAVVIDHNGAGIRQEGKDLYVTHCKFDGNEMGLLGGAIANCKTTIEYSEFINGGSTANPGYQHNVYIGHIDTFIFRYNYSHDAIAEGHELKSRATNNIILYNRLANETTVDSRTIDLPNGGMTVIMGNIIEQGQNSSNSNLLGYGLEGLSNPSPHALYVVNNTFVNKKTTGSFIDVQSGTDTLFVKNNIFAGAKTGGLFIGTPTVLDSSSNLINDDINQFGFINPTIFDYHLLTTSIVKNAGITINKTIINTSLIPTFMYKDTCLFEPRPLAGSLDIGAFEIPFPNVVNELQNMNEQFVFPNPSDSKLFFKTQIEGKYTVYNFTGAKMQEGIIEKNYIDITLLTCGIYFLQTETVKTQFQKIK